MRLDLRVVVPVYRLGFGLLTGAAIVIQFVSLAQKGIVDPVHYFTYFTNLSNIIATVVFLVGAARWRAPRSATFDLVRGGSVVYMTITGVVFAVLLSGINVDAQISWVNDVVHQVMPMAVLADWLIDPPAERLTLRQGALWLSFPLVWIIYEIVRGAITGKYHYPFVNPSNGGYGTVFLYVVAIFVFTLVLCAVIVWLGNLRRPGQPQPQSA